MELLSINGFIDDQVNVDDGLLQRCETLDKQNQSLNPLTADFSIAD